MAEPLNPPPIKDPALSVDTFSSDFDAQLKAETAAARAKPLSDFPGEKPADASASTEPAGNVDDDALRAAVVATTETVEPPEPEKPVVERPAQSTTPAAPVEEKPAAETKPAERPRYDPTEKFGIADGITLTRDQIVQGLRERNAWGQSAKTFEKIFRCTPQQAEQYWAPYVERLVNTPALGDWIDQSIATFDDPDKQQYIARCLEFFDAERGSTQPAARAVVQPATIPPDVRRELDANREFRKQIETQNAEAAVATEKARLTQQFPQLADPALMELAARHTYLILSEQQRAGVPMTYRLTDAVRDLKPVVDRWAAPAQTPAQPAAKVPALNTSSGASASTKNKVDMKPRKFASPDDALADWDANVAPALGFK